MGKRLTSVLVLHQGAESSLDFFLYSAFNSRQWRPILMDTRQRPPEDLGSQLMQARVVMLVRYWPRGWRWRGWLRQARKMGKRCIYWMDDDLLDIDGYEVLPHKYAQKLRRLAWSQRGTILDWCQELWVSTPVLAERYASLNPEVIPLRPQPRILGQVNSFTIGYHGTASHRHELLWLYPLILMVQERYSHTSVELYGDEEMRRLYGSVPRVRVHHPVPWERYLQLTASQRLDCLLCPLMDNGFNRARAAVKFFDAARLNAVGLYSDRVPYSALVKHGEDGLLLADQRVQWLDAIDRLLNDPEWRERLATTSRRRAHDFVN